MADTKNGDRYKIKNIAAILRALEAKYGCIACNRCKI